MSIVAKDVGKKIGDPPTQILTSINFEIPDGQFLSLTGHSGSGKSTLLYLLSGLDCVSSGSVIVDQVDLSRMKKKEVAHFRNEKIGFVFQFNYLIAELSVLENVLLPAKKYGQEKNRLELAKSILEKVGLIEKLNRLPRQLSGGEEQRVAIARSLVMGPKYLFADEPTGSLDTGNGEIVMKMLKEVHEQKGTTVILVTHEPDYARRAQRQVSLADGRIISDSGPSLELSLPV
ncbi:MAG: ABC transporter ATP-binding protein [Bacteriovoracaceae bacterium]|nr:ABC transporter ATP-binding protein [Bacteriovoracaceae bacterium]